MKSVSAVAVASNPGSSTLAVTTGPTTAPDNYTLTISGTSGTLLHSTTAVLRVRRN